MATLNVQADTVTKEASVSINGVDIPMASSASVYIYRDSNGNVTALDMFVNIHDEVEGVRVSINYYAEGSAQAQAALQRGEKVRRDIAGFIGVERPENSLVEDVDRYLSGQKKPF